MLQARLGTKIAKTWPLNRLLVFNCDLCKRLLTSEVRKIGGIQLFRDNAPLKATSRSLSVGKNQRRRTNHHFVGKALKFATIKKLRPRQTPVCINKKRGELSVNDMLTMLTGACSVLVKGVKDRDNGATSTL